MTCTLTRLLLVVAASLLLPVTASAQAFRTYLASYGNDANPCTVSLPCRLLPAALVAVANNGEIWMLDSANFNSGTVNVAKNVIIQAIPGQVGSIVPVAGNPAMTIAAGKVVTLRNVSMVTNANSPGSDAIQMSTGRLSVEDSVLQSSSNGIVINGTGAASVRNTTFRGGSYGIFAAEGATVSVSGCNFAGISIAAIYATAASAITTDVTVRNSDFANNAFTAVWSYVSTASAVARITVANSSFGGNGYGVVSSMDNAGSAIASVGSSVIAGNGIGLYQRGMGAVTEVMGDNVIRNNVTLSSGTITTASRM
ncbi:MAG TPA: right-handed parallel beta-helix repeat-containing protein [Usitatibacter sp.]|nr:right-handed parallel beta-helix repeat-containing protein [Usitatibacter sp.]